MSHSSKDKAKVARKIRAKLYEKSVLFGIIPPPQADPFSENKEHLSDEQKEARRELLEFAHQRRAQYHR